MRLISLLNPKCKTGEIYNICTGKSHKIRDVIQVLKKITKYNPKIIISKKRFRKAEVFNLRGSNKKLFLSTKWKPKYVNNNGFAKALTETYAWFSEENHRNIQILISITFNMRETEYIKLVIEKLALNINHW